MAATASDTYVGRLVSALAALVAAGCVESSWTECADGRVCEPGLVCDVPNGTCADPDCLGKADGAGCETGGRICLAGRCSESCGDGTANGGDQCDGSDLDGWTCLSEGIDRYHGNVTCGSDCTIDSSGCSGSCGDDFRDEAFEFCDPTDFDPSEGADCVSQGFDAGRQGCASDCDALSNDSCARFGWIAEDPVPVASGSIVDIWGADRDLFVLARPGGVRSRNAGWLPVGDGAAIDGRAMFASSAADIWVVSAGGDGFFHWNGTSWIEAASPAGGLNDIWGSSDADIFAVGDDGAVVHFDGTSWAVQATPAPARDLRAIWGAAGQVVAAGEAGTLFRYDGRWTTMASGTSKTLTGVWATSAGAVWTLGETEVRRFDGRRWRAMLALDPGRGGDPGRAWISGTGPGDVWISGGGPAEVQRYDGSRWSTLLLDRGSEPGPLWVDPDSARTAAPQAAVGIDDGGGEGAVKLWYGAGAGPALTASGYFEDVWAADVDSWIAVGSDREIPEGGEALHSNGSIFGFERPLHTVVGFAADRAYASDLETIFEWNGRAWSVTRPAEMDRPIVGLWTSGSQDVYAITTDPVREVAVVLHFDGRSWTELPPIESCGSVGLGGWASGRDDIFVVGNDLLAHFDGSKWSCFDDPAVGNSFRSVWGSGPDDVWADEIISFTQSRRLHHWNGTGWTTQVFEVLFDTKIVLGGLTGTASDDLFLSNIAHYDGRVWSPLRSSAMPGFPAAVLPSRIFTLALDERVGIGQVMRTRFWSPRERELGCDDGVDDDSDGLTDLDDADCAAAPRDPR